ncbi:MAG: alpha-L-fucosidase [Planctomycetaceae bacterium]|nr:alpha-L-fucosidase [Planctomycetaceae bacterium]
MRKFCIFSQMAELFLLCVVVVLFSAVPGGLHAQQKTFDGSWESLGRYSCPDWFRDAKFGIWTCWNPYTVPAVGDWYARNMYIEGSAHYKFHIKNYGHPSKVGYKDIIEMWKGENFDPDNLVDLFKEAGAKYIVAMAAHHDNFDLWNSKHHEWNSVNHGPRQNIIGKWEAAVRKSGLRWGVTSHLERSWNWLAVSHGADKKGEFAGVSYDGVDPKYAGLYFKEYAGHKEDNYHYAMNPPREVIEDYVRRIKDLIDQHKPDLFYFDGGIPFGETGRKLLAYYYNTNIANHGGKLEAVMCIKNYVHGGFHGDGLRGDVAVCDVESGQSDRIKDLPWQTDTSIGDWFWTKGCKYSSPKYVIDQLIDIVSKNGNLLLNVPPRADGTLDDNAVVLLKEIGKWLKVNGEGIYGTRPYSVFGEGPTKVSGGYFTRMATLTAQDFRFTTKGDTVYVFVCGTQTDKVAIKTFAEKIYYRIKSVSMLGAEGELKFEQKDDALHVVLPETKPSQHAICLKITPILIPVPESLKDF